MDRARRAGLVALVSLLLTAVALVGSPPARPALSTAAAVGWPPSTELLLAEVVTGGASASDEWIELTNAGSAPLDLAGLELVYVTSSGGTVTRKASWPAGQGLEPGRHLLLANATGVHASIADATYSGGLAAAGGALVLRPIGGSPIDAVGWGDAVNAFVEGSPAAAPPAGASIERLPGGPGGNVVDTNDNSHDWTLDQAPVPQPLAAGPVPPPSPSAEPSASPSPEPSGSGPASPEPTVGPSGEPSTPPTPSAEPSASPSPEPSASPSPEPSASPSPEPSGSPSPEPGGSAAPSASPAPSDAAAPSADPSVAPSPSEEPAPSTGPSPSPSTEPSPSPGTMPIPIAVARAMPVGAEAVVEGVLTTRLGALDAGRGGVLQDPSGGIALYLDVALPGGPPAGTLMIATGTVDERYGQRTLRIRASDAVGLGPAPLPIARPVRTGDAGEDAEGLRVAIAGTVVEAPSAMADGLGLLVDDGSGSLRVVVAPDANADGPIVRGSAVTAIGPLGQHDSTGTGVSGYRVLVAVPGELSTVEPTPTPSGSPSPDASPSPAPSTAPTPSPSAAPSPSPEPSPEPGADRIALARTRPLGSVVRVAGVVTAEAGTLGRPPLVPIQDDSAAIVLHLPDGVAAPARGASLLVTGRLASSYGQLEIRPEAGAIQVLGEEELPEPLAVRAIDLGESLEARLVVLVARVTASPARATSGDLSVDVVDAQGTPARVMVDAGRGIVREGIVRGTWYRFTGIEGQRASRSGALDGYRVWLRDPGDLEPLAGPPPAAGPATPGGSAAPTGDDLLDQAAPRVIPIAGALRDLGVEVWVEGTVTVGTDLLDASRRRVVLEDPSGAIEALLPGPRTVRIGDRIRVLGGVGTAYGAPRLRATDIEVLGQGPLATPLDLGTAPGEGVEWRLVRVVGRVAHVTRVGDGWRAELERGIERLLVTGLPGAAIPRDRIAVGATVAVTGIVRRPYPTASDRRFAIVPRRAADVAVVRLARASAAPDATAPTASGAGSSRLPAEDVAPGPELIDLARLAEYEGRQVRVGGLVSELGVDGLWLDDGTARGWLGVRGAALLTLAAIRSGDAVLAAGRVEGGPAGAMLVVDDPEGIVLAVATGSLPATIGSSGATSPPSVEAPADAAVRSSEPGDPVGQAGLPLVALSAVAIAGAAGLIRRRLVRRRLDAAIARRLDGLAEPPTRAAGVPFGGPGGELGSRTVRSG